MPSFELSVRSVQDTRAVNTHAFAAKFPEMTYAQLLKAILNELRGKFDQKPQASSRLHMAAKLIY